MGHGVTPQEWKEKPEADGVYWFAAERAAGVFAPPEDWQLTEVLIEADGYATASRFFVDDTHGEPVEDMHGRWCGPLDIPKPAVQPAG